MITRSLLAILLTVTVLPQTPALAQLQFRKIDAPTDVRYHNLREPGLAWSEGKLVGDHWFNFILFSREPWGLHGPRKGDPVTKWVCAFSLKTRQAHWFEPTEIGGKAVHLFSVFPLDSVRVAFAYQLENESTQHWAIWNLESFEVENIEPPEFYRSSFAAWVSDLPASFADSYPTYADALKQLQDRLNSRAESIEMRAGTMASLEALSEQMYFVPTLVPPVPLVDNGNQAGPRVMFFPKDLKTPSEDVVTSEQLEQACHQKDCSFILPARTAPPLSDIVDLAVRFGETKLYGVRLKDKEIADVVALDRSLDDLVQHVVSPSGRYHAYWFAKRSSDEGDIDEGDEIQVYDHDNRTLAIYVFDKDQFLGMLDNGDMVRNVFDDEDNVVVRTYRLLPEGKYEQKLEYRFPRSSPKKETTTTKE